MNTPRVKPLRKLIILAALALIVMAGCAPLVADASATLSAAAPAQISGDDGNVRLARIELKGSVEQISSDSLVVDGQFFRIDDQSVVVSALKAGDRVQVKAVLLPDDSRYAQSVKLYLSDDDSNSFKFYGFVQSIGTDQWMISSTPVSVSASTTISANILVGSFVEVEGRIVNGTMVADKIQLEDGPKMTKTPGVDDGKNGESEFFGVIESISNGVYMISGKTVATNASTEIKGNLAVGMKVKVHATLQSNGSYLAREIEPALPGDDAQKTKTPGASNGEVEFIGKIDGFQNGVLVIGGKTVRTNASTEIKGVLAVGVMVKVHASLQSDGSYLAREIELTSQDDNSGKSGTDDDKSGKGSDDSNDDNSGSGSNSGKGSGDDDDDDDNSGKGGDDYGKDN